MRVGAMFLRNIVIYIYILYIYNVYIYIQYIVFFNAQQWLHFEFRFRRGGGPRGAPLVKSLL